MECRSTHLEKKHTIKAYCFEEMKIEENLILLSISGTDNKY